MTKWDWIALTLFGLAQGCILMSNFIFASRVGEVNASPNKSREFSLFGWHFFKHREFSKEYDRLYPHSKKKDQEILCFLIGVILFAGSIAAFFVGHVL